MSNYYAAKIINCIVNSKLNVRLVTDGACMQIILKGGVAITQAVVVQSGNIMPAMPIHMQVFYYLRCAELN